MRVRQFGFFTDNDTRDHGRQRAHVSCGVTIQLVGV
jgi:hypothetical protein